MPGGGVRAERQPKRRCYATRADRCSADGRRSRFRLFARNAGGRNLSTDGCASGRTSHRTNMRSRLLTTTAVLIASATLVAGCSGAPDATRTVTATVTQTSGANVHGSIQVAAWSSEPYQGSFADTGAGGKLSTPDGSWSFYADRSNVSSYLTGDTKAYYVSNGTYTAADATSTPSTTRASTSQSDFTLLPIGWTFTAPAPTAGVDAPASSSASRTKIALLAGGRSIPLAGNLNGGGKAVVAIPANAVSGAVVQVTYAGLVQKYDPFTGRLLTTGAAAGLYDNLSSVGTGSCPPIKSGFDSSTGVQINATCGIVSVTRSAYNPENGWAPTGTVWVTVVAILPNTTATYRLNGVDPAVYKLTPKVTAAGLGGTKAWSATVTGQQTTLIFAAPARHASLALSMQVTYTGTTTDPRTVSPTITVTPAAPTSAPAPSTSAATSTTSGTPTSAATPTSGSTSSATPAPQTFTLTPIIPGTVTIPVTVNTTVQFASLGN